MIKVTFDREKETKNTIRFQEREADQAPVIGTLYVRKWVLRKLNNPESITLTIEAVK